MLTFYTLGFTSTIWPLNHYSQELLFKILKSMCKEVSDSLKVYVYPGIQPF